MWRVHLWAYPQAKDVTRRRGVLQKARRQLSELGVTASSAPAEQVQARAAGGLKGAASKRAFVALVGRQRQLFNRETAAGQLEARAEAESSMGAAMQAKRAQLAERRRLRKEEWERRKALHAQEALAEIEAAAASGAGPRGSTEAHAKEAPGAKQQTSERSARRQRAQRRNQHVHDQRERERERRHHERQRELQVEEAAERERERQTGVLDGLGLSDRR
jgi:hypothetical protein